MATISQKPMPPGCGCCSAGKVSRGSSQRNKNKQYKGRLLNLVIGTLLFVPSMSTFVSTIKLQRNLGEYIRNNEKINVFVPPSWHLEPVRESSASKCDLSPLPRRKLRANRSPRRCDRILPFETGPVSLPTSNNMRAQENDYYEVLFPKIWEEEVAIIHEDTEYQRRKDEWAAKYTSMESLRKRLGRNQNSVWGDLDAGTARRLYKTLLPSALLELYKIGVRAEDLAPLAYSARKAAKLYSRYRCQIPSRVFAHLYDGFRQWRRYGSFDITGISYQQIWEKYSQAIWEESDCDDEDLTYEDLSSRTCLRILERSCATNQIVDRFCISKKRSEEDLKDLQHITNQLESDLHELLRPVRSSERLREEHTQVAIQ